MFPSDASLPADGDLVLHIIDRSTGRPIQSWTFRDKFEITIGRSADQDIELSDPFVSRNHATLVRGAAGWVLLSTGRNGVVVNNQLVKEAPIHEELIFQLGVNGPTLKVAEQFSSGAPDATFAFDSPVKQLVFQLDREQLQCEVEEIADGDYFQRLQSLAREARQRKPREPN